MRLKNWCSAPLWRLQPITTATCRRASANLCFPFGVFEEITFPPVILLLGERCNHEEKCLPVGNLLKSIPTYDRIESRVLWLTPSIAERSTPSVSRKDSSWRLILGSFLPYFFGFIDDMSNSFFTLESESSSFYCYSQGVVIIKGWKKWILKASIYWCQELISLIRELIYLSDEGVYLSDEGVSLSG